MRIENSIQHPNQQAFNGYVGRNCKNAVNHAVKVLAKADLATANAQGTMLDVNTIKSYQNLGKFANDLINKFNPEMIDKKLFNNLKDRRYKSVEEGCFLDRAFAYRDAKKLVKIAPEFHVNPDGILYGMKKRIVNNRKAEEKHKILLKKRRIADKAEQRAQAEKRSQNQPQIDLNNKIFRTMFGK